MSDDSPIFIVGMQRSGTTLMRALLSAHPRVAIAPETHYLEMLPELGWNSPLVGREHFISFWKRYRDTVRFRDTHLDAGEVAQRIVEEGLFTPPAVFSVLLREYARSIGRERWGEKTPTHYHHVSTLLSWFPDARIIHVIRDPRAVCASAMRTPWDDPAERARARNVSAEQERARVTDRLAREWATLERRQRIEWSGDSNIHLVRYEDLVLHPDETSRRICSFIGESFNDAMLERRDEETVPPPSEEVYGGRYDGWRTAHLSRARSDIDPGGVDRWSEELTTAQVCTIERICGDGMKRLGYARSDIRFPQRAVSSLGDLAARIRWRLERSW